MRRDEAFAKATQAVAQFAVDRKAHYGRSGTAPFDPPPPADWLQPTVHQVIAALEAIGVVKFDAEQPCPFDVGDPVRNRETKAPLGKVTHVVNRRSVTLDKCPGMWNVRALELDEPACPFAVGDLVRRKVKHPDKPRPIYRVLLVNAIFGTPEDYWDVVTDDGNSFRVSELERYVPQLEPKATRRIHRVPTDNDADIYEDTLVETLRMIGYDVTRRLP